MNLIDIRALMPLIVVSATAVVVMLTAAFRRRRGLIVAETVVGLVTALAALGCAAAVAPRQVTPLLVVDSLSLFYSGLMLAATLLTALFAHGYFSRTGGPHEEFYILLLLAAAGAMVLAVSNHLMSFFLGLEILSISLYGLIAYHRNRKSSAEAGIKYVILGAAAAAFLVFGMALVYFRTGEMGFVRVAAAAGGSVDGVMLGGLALMLVAIGFKLSVVPFHMWAGDVYDGAPAPVTALIATVSKGSVFVLILRYFAALDVRTSPSVLGLLALLAGLSMFGGNLLALLQTNVKRMLAYSSIAHVGYILVAFMATGPAAPMAVTLYLVVYFITTLGAFGVVSVLSGPDRDADALDDYRGLAWRRPWLAVAMTASLLSLAGIPLTAGFIGKFYVVTAGVESGLWGLIGVLVVNSAIGIYYYLRVVTVMFADAPPAAAGTEAVVKDVGRLLAERIALVVLTVLLFWFGVHPAPLIRAIGIATRALL